MLELVALLVFVGYMFPSMGFGAGHLDVPHLMLNLNYENEVIESCTLVIRNDEGYRCCRKRANSSIK